MTTKNMKHEEMRKGETVPGEGVLGGGVLKRWRGIGNIKLKSVWISRIKGIYIFISLPKVFPTFAVMKLKKNALIFILKVRI